jgi:hypothetical protein
VESGERGGRVMVLFVSTSVENFDPYWNEKMWKRPVLLIYHTFGPPFSKTSMRNSSSRSGHNAFEKRKLSKERLEHYLCSTKYVEIWALFFNFIQFMRVAAAQILALRPLTFSERWVVVLCPNTLLIIRSLPSSLGFVRTSH